MAKTFLAIIAVTTAILATYALASIAYIVGLLVHAIWGTGSTASAAYDGSTRQLVGVGSSIAIVMPVFLIGMLILFYVMSSIRWKVIPNPPHRRPLDNRGVTVVLTAYQDEASIGSSVEEFIAQPHVKKVLVIDNNSTDRTTEVATRAGAAVIRETTQGYGAACTRGLREGLLCDSSIILLSEGDMTFQGTDVDKFTEYLEDADLVIGTRTTRELLYSGTQMGAFMTWGNLLLAKLVQVKFFDMKHFGRVRLTDVGCTMRAIRKEDLAKIVGQFRVTGESFSPHMIMIAVSSGLRVVEVPVVFRPRVGESKGAGGNRKRAIRIGLRMFWEIITF